jgi:hypothetical protein
MAYDNTDNAQAYQQPPDPVPSDYDEKSRPRAPRPLSASPPRGGKGRSSAGRRRFIAEGLARVLDLGCGEGELVR